MIFLSFLFLGLLFLCVIILPLGNLRINSYLPTVSLLSLLRFPALSFICMKINWVSFSFPSFSFSPLILLSLILSPYSLTFSSPLLLSFPLPFSSALILSPPPLPFSSPLILSPSPLFPPFPFYSIFLPPFPFSFHPLFLFFAFRSIISSSFFVPILSHCQFLSYLIPPSLFSSFVPFPLH